MTQTTLQHKIIDFIKTLSYNIDRKLLNHENCSHNSKLINYISR